MVGGGVSTIKLILSVTCVVIFVRVFRSNASYSGVITYFELIRNFSNSHVFRGYIPNSIRTMGKIKETIIKEELIE